jgi:hypothetical protein
MTAIRSTASRPTAATTGVEWAQKGQGRNVSCISPIPLAMARRDNPHARWT